MTTKKSGRLIEIAYNEVLVFCLTEGKFGLI